MTPRQTQPVPQIIVTAPSDDESGRLVRRNAVSRPTRQILTNQTNATTSSRPTQTLRPRATTGLVVPSTAAATRRSFFPVKASGEPPQAQNPSPSPTPEWASHFEGDPEDVKAALTELLHENGNINERRVADRVAQIQARRNVFKEYEAQELAHVADGTYRLAYVSNPSSDDKTPQAAQIRYQNRQQGKADYMQSLLQLAQKKGQ